MWQISVLISRMQQDWPTLGCPSNSGTTFWSHEWNKHGTCSESVLNQHAYFKSALNLKSKLDLLQILQSAGNSSTWLHQFDHFFRLGVKFIYTTYVHRWSASTPFNIYFYWYVSQYVSGINPDGGLYSFNSIRITLTDAIGYTPGIECNVDESNSQLYQVYICVDTSASNVVECPILPNARKCASIVEFPTF